MYSLVEDASRPPNNAGWSSALSRVSFGIGNGQLPFSGALDVVAHALTERSAGGLSYAYEPGALNEAFSDWMGVAIEYAYLNSDWTIGEEINATLRDLKTPLLYGQPDTYKGDLWVPLETCNTPVCDWKNPDYNDCCGVHTNSGVPNKMFYLLSEGATHNNITVQGIGIGKAIQIAYKANMEIWLNNATFAKALEGMVWAAENLPYGTNEVNQVKNAWAAVGIGTIPTIIAGVSSSAGGTVSGAGSYSWGSTATLVATANAGYTFVNWTENGIEVSTSASYSFTVDGDSSLIANFETCIDNDGDGYGSPGDFVCPKGAAEDCDDTNPDINPGANDFDCNGVDDDCDGVADDDYVQIRTICGTGACASSGQLVCFDGALVNTCIAGAPTSDDSDCDGIVDNNYVPTSTTCGTGVCASIGEITCVGGNESDTCTSGIPTEVPEIGCTDGLDNDCEGLTDTSDSDCVSADWYNVVWPYRQQVTISSNMTVNTDQANFPVLIKITDPANPVFADAEPDGGDILFTSSNGVTTLDHEIERFDNTPGSEELVAWVRMPNLSSSTDTVIYMYYGNIDWYYYYGGANPQGVWNSAYKGVWHLNKDEIDETTGGVHIDSTSNLNDGTQNNNSTATSQIYTGQSFDGSGDYITVPDSPSLKFGISDFTVSLWVWLDDTGSNQFLVNKYPGGGGPGFHLDVVASQGGVFRVMEHSNAVDFSLFGTSTVSDGSWHLLTYVRHSYTGVRELWVEESAP